MDFDHEELLALARIDIEKGRLEEALGKLKRVIGEEKSSPDAVILLARLYAQLGMMKRARELFERYLVLKPEALHEKFELGMTHFDEGETEAAMKLWGQVLEAQPFYPPALYYRAVAQASTGAIPEAKRSIDVLLKSVAEENLYYNKARDLLRGLDQGAGQSLQKQDGNPANPYFSKTEH